MKKWIGSLFAAFFLMLAFPSVAASAAAGGALAVNGRSITVALDKPETAEAVTSIRFWVYVKVLEGDMTQPEFQFTEKAGDGDIVVTDAVIRRRENLYMLDMIVAAKGGTDLFRGAKQASIGTLILYPAAETVKAEIGFAPESADGSGQPVVRYVSGAGQSEKAVILKGIESAAYTGSVSDVKIPAVTEPVLPAVPDLSGSGQFQAETAPELKLEAKGTIGYVYFSWKQAAGADGYKIYQYQESTGKYKCIRTIAKADETAYSKKMKYGTVYTFRMRAFCNKPDGGRIYSAYSEAGQIITAPAEVKGMKVSDGAVPLLSWKQVKSAAGYQVFQSTNKKDGFSCVKTIKNKDTCSYFIKNQTGGKAFYKVRAYVIKADGKRKYGMFSMIVS